MRKDSKYNVFCCKLMLKIFINDLPCNIQNTDNDVDLNDNFIYADDVVLLSKSQMGLQQKFDCLSKFCKDWCLTVNVSKTDSNFNQ